jgi:hypothetical protein
VTASTIPNPPTNTSRWTFEAYKPTTVEELAQHEPGHSLVAYHADGLEFAYVKTSTGLWALQAHRAIRPHVLARYPVARRLAAAVDAGTEVST